MLPSAKGKSVIVTESIQMGRTINDRACIHTCQETCFPVFCWNNCFPLNFVYQKPAPWLVHLYSYMGWYQLGTQWVLSVNVESEWFPKAWSCSRQTHSNRSPCAPTVFSKCRQGWHPGRHHCQHLEGIAPSSHYDPHSPHRPQHEPKWQSFQVFLTIFTHKQNLFTTNLFNELLRAIQMS